MVQHLRDVGDSLSLLGEAQHEVVILRSVKAFAEPTDIDDQLAFGHQEVGDVVLVPQPFR